MENKLRYTADILFNAQTIDSHSSDHLNRLTAQVIHQIETHYPNATGAIRDNSNGAIVQRCCRSSCD